MEKAGGLRRRQLVLTQAACSCPGPQAERVLISGVPMRFCDQVGVIGKNGREGLEPLFFGVLSEISMGQARHQATEHTLSRLRTVPFPHCSAPRSVSSNCGLLRGMSLPVALR